MKEDYYNELEKWSSVDGNPQGRFAIGEYILEEELLKEKRNTAQKNKEYCREILIFLLIANTLLSLILLTTLCLIMSEFLTLWLFFLTIPFFVIFFWLLFEEFEWLEKKHCNKLLEETE